MVLPKMKETPETYLGKTTAVTAPAYFEIYITFTLKCDQREYEAKTQQNTPAPIHQEVNLFNFD